jgi:hypothetical protein
MAAKQLIFNEHARQKILDGVTILTRCSKSNPGTSGKKCNN